MRLLDSLAVSFFLTVIALCLIASFRFINFQSTLTLLIFNVFFVTLFFQLNGSPTMKTATLAVGNGLGLFWNFLFHDLSVAGSAGFGTVFSAFFTILYPILNLMWIVPFWSLSLSFLPKLAPQTTDGAVEA